uniref:Uncharacterized protein n=1 Tax=Acrobeloides nanus TaxID=290746 RepID=A0A914EDA9_9BILA
MNLNKDLVQAVAAIGGSIVVVSFPPAMANASLPVASQQPMANDINVPQPIANVTQFLCLGSPPNSGGFFGKGNSGAAGIPDILETIDLLDLVVRSNGSPRPRSKLLAIGDINLCRQERGPFVQDKIGRLGNGVLYQERPQHVEVSGPANGLQPLTNIFGNAILDVATANDAFAANQDQQPTANDESYEFIESECSSEFELIEADYTIQYGD